MTSGLRQKLHQRWAQQVFIGALRDYATGQLRRKTAAVWAARLLASFIIASPFCLLAAGIWLITFDFPNLLAFAGGALLLAAGWSLVPRRFRTQGRPLLRDDLPLTFDLLDQIAEKLNTTTPDGVYLSADLNASIHAPFLARHRNVWLVIGLPLWQTLNTSERIALLAHELAHRVNGDLNAQRCRSVGTGNPDPLARPVRTIANICGWRRGGRKHPYRISHEHLGNLTDWISVLLDRLVYLDSQRAEYLADALAAEVAGSDAVIGLLNICARGDDFSRAANALSADFPMPDATVFQHLAQAVRDITPDREEALIAAREAALISVDITHRPTAFRIAFVQSLRLNTPTDAVPDQELTQIDAELAPHASKLATDLYRSMMVQ